MPSDGEPILGSGLNRSESRRGEAHRWLAGGRKRMWRDKSAGLPGLVTHKRRYRRRTSASSSLSTLGTNLIAATDQVSQSRPRRRTSDPCPQLHSSTSVSVVGARIFSVTVIAKCVARSAWGRFGQAASSAGRRNTRGRSKVLGALTERQPSWPHLAAMLDDMRR
jgi:hypothetical protein